MMRPSLFVDTSGWACYFHASDPFHAEAVRQYQSIYAAHGLIVTTDHVLAELVALLASKHYKLSRPRVIVIISAILHDQGVTIESTDWQRFMEAWNLLEQRQDKQWSLADAISFRAMDRLGVLDALTTDEHFEQAGKIRLLK